MKVVVASLLCVGLAAGARAHSFEPGLLDVREDATGAITVTWAPPLGAQPDALVPHLDAPCRRLDGDALAWHADCGGAGLSGRAIAVRGLDGSRTDVVVRVSTRDGATTTGVLRADADRMVVPRPHDTAVGAVLRSYGALGVAHILGGTDHLLFVLGLMLLVRSLGTLVRTVTAFTVAHSITLALAVLGLVAVPTRSVEVLIALSIVMVATEVVRSPDVPSTVAARAPWVVALAFGLLHGLGFAGALADVGLPPERVPLALVGFNLGVEVGQLAFIAAMLLPLAAFARLAAARPRLRLVPGYLMGVVAATWTLARLERLWLPVVFVLVLAAPAAALRIPGGKVPASDCLAEFQLAGPTTTCTDCDPSCDHDGASDANGSCTFEVSLCVNQRSAECSPGTLSRVRVHPGTALEVPAAACGTLHPLTVKTRGRGTRPGKTNIRVLALTSGKPRRRDRNLLKLVCLPRPAGQACPTTEVHEACVNRNPLRNAYFGDLHVHTTLSFDAHAFDVRTTPDQAYRFAQGDPVSLPPLDANGQGTQTVRLDRPLDFTAVTDHSEFLGEIEACTTPGSAVYDSPTCTLYRGAALSAVVTFGLKLTPQAPARFADVCGADGHSCLDVAGPVWQRVIDAAEGAYDRTPACRFTSFVAYEYSGSPKVSNMHRNVIFRNDHVPFPTTFFEQPTPQGLWNELHTTCLEAGNGCDVLAIPHNPNESNGNMFAVEYPGAGSPADERAQAAFRGAIEPLIEVYQHKGDSECQNGLSGIIGAPDEQCNFEKSPRTGYGDCGDGTGMGGTARIGCYSRRDFLRGILLTGLQEDERLGINPYRLGVIASTDSHNGTPGNVEEDRFVGHRGTDDDTPEKQLGHGALTPGGIMFGPGGLAGVWAEENTRPSLFDALRRREVFGTSGPRITVRFFGGWDLPAGLCSDPSMVATAYAAGVPMGSDLPVPPAGTGAPTFLLTALRDAGTPTRPGVPLQRLQVVKGWLEGGEAHEQVFDVAGDSTTGAFVDVATCTPHGTGADSLCTVWTDPQFQPGQLAFYYVRVLENPTCRWSTWVCNRLPPAERPATCNDPNVPATIQERAWTSPIWYRPAS